MNLLEEYFDHLFPWQLVHHISAVLFLQAEEVLNVLQLQKYLVDQTLVYSADLGSVFSETNRNICKFISEALHIQTCRLGFHYQSLTA